MVSEPKLSQARITNIAKPFKISFWPNCVVDQKIGYGKLSSCHSICRLLLDLSKNHHYLRIDVIQYRYLSKCFRYASKAKPEDFEIYSPDASFEDPLMRAQGYELFFWLPQVLRWTCRPWTSCSVMKYKPM